MRDKQKPKDPLAYRKHTTKRVCRVEWGSQPKLVRQAERRGKLVRRAAEWGNPFFDGVGKASGNGEGRRTSRASEVKGRPAREAARSVRGASPWPLRHWRRSRLGSRRFTRKERTRTLQRTQKRGVHARAADVLVSAFLVAQFKYTERRKEKLPRPIVRECTYIRRAGEKFRSAVWFFFFLVDFSGDSRCHGGFPGTDRRQPSPLRFSDNSHTRIQGRKVCITANSRRLPR